MTSRRATLILLAVLALGGAMGLAAGAGLVWMTPSRSVEPFDPRALVRDLDSRSEARYRKDVETCRELVSLPSERSGLLDCLQKNGYRVSGRS